MRTWRAFFALVTPVLAWSGMLLAEGPGQVADDVGSSTPRRHAPRRKPVKRRGRTKPNRPADAGAAPMALPQIEPSAPTSPDAGADDDDDDDDDEDASAPSGVDAVAPRRSRTTADDAGADASAEEDDEGDDEDESDDDDTAYELGVELASESRLVWRGLAESRGAVAQTSAWAGFYGLGVEGFGSYLLNTEGPFAPFTVVGADLTGSYAFSVGDVRVRPGITLLYFPEGLSSSTTAEASLGLSYRLGDFAVVSGTNVDVSLQPGAYFGTLGATWGRAMPPWTVKTIADVGWASAKYNDEYLGRDLAALDVIHGGASARYDLGSVAYVELHVDVSGLVAPTLRGSVQEPVILVGGAAMGLDWSVGR